MGSITRSTTPDTLLQTRCLLRSAQLEDIDWNAFEQSQVEEYLIKIIDENALNIKYAKTCKYLAGFDKKIIAVHRDVQEEIESEDLLPPLYKKIYLLAVQQNPWALLHVPTILILKNSTHTLHSAYQEIVDVAIEKEPSLVFFLET